MVQPVSTCLVHLGTETKVSIAVVLASVMACMDLNQDVRTLNTGHLLELSNLLVDASTGTVHTLKAHLL